MALSKHATSAAGELSSREDTGLGPSGQRIKNTNNHHEEAVAKGGWCSLRSGLSQPR